MNPSVLAVTGNSAVVDWVFLELRNAVDPSVIVATQSVLVRRDGIIIDAEGSPGIYFGNVPEANYYLSVRHRNHFGVRTANSWVFTKGVATSFDFTSTTAPLYTNSSITTNPPTKVITVSGVDYRTLWAGDINRDGIIKYTGAGNDRAYILRKIGGLLTATANGYLSEDINLDGLCKYNGAANDKAIISSNVGGVLTNFILQHL